MSDTLLETSRSQSSTWVYSWKLLVEFIVGEIGNWFGCIWFLGFAFFILGRRDPYPGNSGFPVPPSEVFG
jgi:hypothetical protein